jgi:hypothetical protein
MSEPSTRAITRCRFPLSATFDLSCIERLVIEYDSYCTIDFGAVCYLRRSASKRKPKHGRTVDFTTFSETRANSLRIFLREASSLHPVDGLRVSTTYNSHANFVRFLDWCDENEHSDALSSPNNARSAFTAYLSHLKRLVNENKLHLSTAHSYQSELLGVLDSHYQFEGLASGVQLLAKRDSLSQPTLVPSEEAQSQVLAWCSSFLWGFSDLVLNARAFPFELSIPKYLNWPGDHLWVFPLHNWCRTPDDPRGNSTFIVYDFQNGRLRDLNEIRSISSSSDNSIKLMIANAKRRLATANSNERDHSRRNLALLAMRAFFLMFIATTGMNPSQAVSLPWNENLSEAVREPTVERQGFRTVKYRAQDRLVSFELGIQYLPAFRRYLEVRDFSLAGQTSDLLFGFEGAQRTESSRLEIGRGKLQAQALFEVLNRICPSLPRILPMQLRAAKQDYVIRNYDPATAATAMQHSQDTAMRHYTNGSQAAQEAELHSYFVRVEQVVLSRKSSQTMEARPMGACSSPNLPTPLLSSSIRPDCTRAEGCLFCDKYRIHADFVDVKKLLSARLYLRKVSSLATNPSHFQGYFGAIFQRIEEVLKALRRHNAPLVEQIELQVDSEGELDGYWSAKLDLLIELNIV